MQGFVKTEKKTTFVEESQSRFVTLGEKKTEFRK